MHALVGGLVGLVLGAAGSGLVMSKLKKELLEAKAEADAAAKGLDERLSKMKELLQTVRGDLAKKL